MDNFINKLIEDVDLERSLEAINSSKTRPLNVESILSLAKELLKAFFSYSELNLRQIEQSIYRLGLVFKSLRRDLHPFISPAVVVTILRALDENLYYEFYHNRITDLYLVDKLFGDLDKKKENFSYHIRRIENVEHFEAAIYRGIS